MTTLDHESEIFGALTLESLEILALRKWEGM